MSKTRVPGLKASIKGDDYGNYTARIEYKGELLWSGCYGQHRYAVMGVERNYQWCAEKAMKQEKPK